MNKNKTTKYFKYAIGEIVLVVIGILIAIQLNEWRKESSNYKQKQVVLNSLKLEFEANLNQLDTVFFYINKVKETYPLVNKLIKEEGNNYTDDEISKTILNLGWNWSFNPTNGALRSAVSSGDIHLLNDKRLIELLFNWEDVVKDSEEEANRLRQYQYDSNNMLSKYIRVSDLWGSYFDDLAPAISPTDYKGLLKEVALEDYASYSYVFAREYLIELESIKKHNKEILILIKRELSS